MNKTGLINYGSIGRKGSEDEAMVIKPVPALRYSQKASKRASTKRKLISFILIFFLFNHGKIFIPLDPSNISYHSKIK